MFFLTWLWGINEKRLANIASLFLVGWNMGFEPMTFGTTIRRSNQLS